MRTWRKAALILVTLAGGWVGANLLLSDAPCAAASSGECGKPVPYRVDLPPDQASWQVGKPRPFEAPPDRTARDWMLERGVVTHRVGKQWRTVALPDVPIPSTVTDRAKLAPVSVTELAVAGPKEVWAVGDVTTHLCCALFSHHREVIMRWDGASWQLLDLGLRGVELTEAAIDRRGGLWIAAQNLEARTAVLLHHENGRWTRSHLPLPAGVRQVEDIAFERDRVTATAYRDQGLPITVTWGPSR